MNLTKEEITGLDNSSNQLITYNNEYSLSGSTLLNNPDYHHTAAIAHRLTYRGQVVFDKSKMKIERSIVYIDGSVWISDCNRSISLDLTAHNENTTLENSNSLDKLTKLITELETCKANLEKMIKDKEKHYQQFKQVTDSTKLVTDLTEFKEKINS